MVCVVDLSPYRLGHAVLFSSLHIIVMYTSQCIVTQPCLYY